MTTITTLPPAPSRDDANTFASKADAFLSALPTFGTQTNAVASEINAAAAQAAASVSLLSVDGYTGSTTTSFTIASSGSQSVTTQTGRLWVVGTSLQITSTASPSNYVVGQVSAYSGSSLTITIQKSGGSGTFADWKIGLASAYIMPNDAVINGVTVGKGANSGNFNTALGVSALASGTGGYNVAVGYEAILSGSTAVATTAIGYRAFKSPTAGVVGVAVGSEALTSITSGDGNTAVGRTCLRSLTYGGWNTSVGDSSQYSNVSGGFNASLGYGALWNNVSGSSNVAVGASALYSSTASTNNTAIGYESLYYANSSAYENVAVGYRAAKGASSGLSGTQNTAVGYTALVSLTNGVSNTAVGAFSSNSATTAITTTAIGFSALSANVSYSNVTGLGAGSAVTGSNQVQLGDSGTTTYAYGTVQNRSDIRDKTDIRDTVLGLDFIKAIRPVDYRLDMREDYKPARPADIPEYANDDEKAAHALAIEAWQNACKWSNLQHDGTHKRNRYHHGVIAQEVQAVIEQTGVDFGGFQDHKISGGEDVLSIGYSEFIAPLIKAVQELAAQNAELSARIATLEAK